MQPITNLSQFKKALKPGVKIDVTVHKIIGSDPATGAAIIQGEVKPTRTISIVQSNSFAIATQHYPSMEIKNSWVEFPKAANVEFNDNAMTIYTQDHINKGPRVKSLTISFPDHSPVEIQNLEECDATAAK